jgi:hypothetical protein
MQVSSNVDDYLIMETRFLYESTTGGAFFSETFHANTRKTVGVEAGNRSLTT